MYRIHPKLMPYVTALTSHKFGLQGMVAEVENIECGNIFVKKEKRWGDRFNLRIFYCTKKLTWQVLMCPNNLMEPPDFIMEDDFLADADRSLIESQVPSLVHWEPSNPKCLLNVILELLELYKLFQSDFLKINRESRLCLEYDLLLNCVNTPFSDMEIYVHNPARVSFLMHLKIDFSKLPIAVPKQKYLVLLLVELRENTKNVVSLHKSRELDEVFSNINVPELGSNMMVVEYVQWMEEYVRSKVDDLVQRINKRKMLYCYLVQAFEPALLNGDNITFQNISFLLEINYQYFVLNIEIPSTFPDDRPEINISPMRKSKSGAKLFVPLKNFKYDAQWDTQKIFRYIYDYIRNGAIQIK